MRIGREMGTCANASSRESRSIRRGNEEDQARPAGWSSSRSSLRRKAMSANPAPGHEDSNPCQPGSGWKRRGVQHRCLSACVEGRANLWRSPRLQRFRLRGGDRTREKAGKVSADRGDPTLGTEEVQAEGEVIRSCKNGTTACRESSSVIEERLTEPTAKHRIRDCSRHRTTRSARSARHARRTARNAGCGGG